LGLRVSVAAVILFAVIGGGYLWYNNYHRIDTPKEFVATQHIKVPHNEYKSVTLADGTEVTLNEDSEFSYGDGRECSLVGEAYFNVSKSDAPFVVHTPHMDVTVLGTEFNLAARRDSVLSVVSLYSGSVEIKYPQGVQHLEPGLEFAYNSENKLINVNRFDLDQELKPLWLGGDESGVYSLGDIFCAIEDCYGVIIVNKGFADTSRHYSFRLVDDGGPVDTVMTALKFVSDDFDYRIEGTKIILLETAKKR
jgi:hypothetical protein